MNHEQAPPQDESTSQPPASTRVLLFDAEGDDRPIDPGTLVLDRLAEHELAWIDVTAHDEAEVAKALRPLGLDRLPVAQLLDAQRAPLFSHEDWWGARALAPAWNDAHVRSAPWLLLAGPNVIVSVHRDAIPFLDDIAEHHDPTSSIGKLGADSFAAALLDRMLTAYFEAVDAFEIRLDKVEVDILQPRLRSGHLLELRKLRRQVSGLRRLLTSHRDLFDALARPDFQPDQDEKIDKQFRAVSARYERAVDAIENARDLVIGSYELLTTRLSQRTNDTMQLLTFVTVVLGTLAVGAGVLGMNFNAPLFHTGAEGFWTTVGGMAAFVLLAMLLARWRGWWK